MARANQLKGAMPMNSHLATDQDFRELTEDELNCISGADGKAAKSGADSSGPDYVLKVTYAGYGFSITTTGCLNIYAGKSGSYGACL